MHLCGHLRLQALNPSIRNSAGQCTDCSEVSRALQVLPEVVACEIGVLLLTVPTEDSVEMAVNFLKETGALLSDTNRLMVQE